MNHAELQRQLERVEGRLFWLDDRLYRIVVGGRGGGLDEEMGYHLGLNDAIKHEGVLYRRKPKGPRLLPLKEGCPRWNVFAGYGMWMATYLFFAALVLWWAHDRIYYEIDIYVIASVVLMVGLVIAIPLIVVSQDGVLMHDAMKPRNLRHYHHPLPAERPLMREKLEAERAELLEMLAR
jgi:hypothetical protein